MFRNRVFNVLIAIGLAITLAFTVREAFATNAIPSQANSRSECADLPSRYSIHSEYNEEAGIWILSTEDGPVGVDGGLKELASALRRCSR